MTDNLGLIKRFNLLHLLSHLRSLIRTQADKQTPFPPHNKFSSQTQTDRSVPSSPLFTSHTQTDKQRVNPVNINISMTQNLDLTDGPALPLPPSLLPFSLSLLYSPSCPLLCPPSIDSETDRNVFRAGLPVVHYHKCQDKNTTTREVFRAFRSCVLRRWQIRKKEEENSLFRACVLHVRR